MLTQLGKIGHIDSDSKELKIQKSFLVYLALFMSGGGLVWGSISLFYGLTIPSLIPYGYLVVTVFNLIYFKARKDFKTVRFIQVFISLVLPVVFQWMLGGFMSSGGIILWSLLSLIASLSFTSLETSIRWLVFFVMLAVATAVFDGQAQTLKPDVLPDASPLFSAINIILISTIVFGLVAFFVGQYQKTKKEVEIKTRQVVKIARELKNNYELLKTNYSNLKHQVESNTQKEDDTMNHYEDILVRQKKMIEEFDQS